jgi:hypothetical protein
MGTIKRGLALLKASRQVIKINPMLGLYPFFASFSVIILVSAVFGAGYFVAPELAVKIATQPDTPVGPVLTGVFTLLGLIALTWVTTFLNVIFYLMASAAIEGSRLKLGLAIKEAWTYKGVITSWAIVAATVGYLIRLVQERLGFLGAIFGFLAGVAWAFAIVFVVPILVTKRMKPFAAVKYSAQLFKKTWGENLVADLALATVSGLILAFGFLLPLLAVVILGIVGTLALIPAIILGVALALGMIYVGSYFQAVNMVFNVSLFRYAETGDYVGPFTQEMIQGAYKPNRGLKARS